MSKPFHLADFLENSHQFEIYHALVEQISKRLVDNVDTQKRYPIYEPVCRSDAAMAALAVGALVGHYNLELMNKTHGIRDAEGLKKLFCDMVDRLESAPNKTQLLLS